jgi:hypothetical protein
MAVRTIETVQGNSAPAIALTAKRGTAVIDVTGCTVELIIAKGTTVTNTGHQTCTLTTPASGVVTYQPEAADFATPGAYKGDLKITYPSLKVEILYDQLKFKVRKHL